MVLRELAELLGAPTSRRDELQDFGDKLRREHDDQGLLARLTLRRIRADHLSHQNTTGPAPRIAIGGFKHPAEVDVFSSIPEFRLIALTIPDQASRYRRGIDSGALEAELGEAGGDLDGDVEAQFEEMIDHRDLYGLPDGDVYGQAVAKIMEAVPEEDRVNNRTDGTEELFRHLSNKVHELDLKHRLPRGH